MGGTKEERKIFYENTTEKKKKVKSHKKSEKKLLVRSNEETEGEKMGGTKEEKPPVDEKEIIENVTETGTTSSMNTGPEKDLVINGGKEKKMSPLECKLMNKIQADLMEKVAVKEKNVTDSLDKVKKDLREKGKKEMSEKGDDKKNGKLGDEDENQKEGMLKTVPAAAEVDEKGEKIQNAAPAEFKLPLDDKKDKIDVKDMMESEG